MQIHDCTLLDVAGACGPMEPTKGLSGARAAQEGECSAIKSSAKLNGFAWIASGSPTEKPVASGWLSGSHKWIFVR